MTPVLLDVAPQSLQHLGWTVQSAAPGSAGLAAYAQLRRRVFVEEQGLFPTDDHDAVDRDPLTRQLLATTLDGEVLGGVRVHPVDLEQDWWRGSRLVCGDDVHVPRGAVGAALVRAACRLAVGLHARRFDAHVQERHGAFFARLGWQDLGPITVAAKPHRRMRFPTHH